MLQKKSDVATSDGNNALTNAQSLGLNNNGATATDLAVYMQTEGDMYILDSS